MFKRLTQLRTWLAAAVATTNGTGGFGVLDMRLLSDWSIADMVLKYPQGYLQTAIHGIGYENLVDMLGRSTASSLLSMAANPTVFELVSFEQLATTNTVAWWGVGALVLYKVAQAFAKYEESLTPEQKAERAARRAENGRTSSSNSNNTSSEDIGRTWKRQDLLRLADKAEETANYKYRASKKEPMASMARQFVLEGDRLMADARKMRAQAAAL